MTKKIQDISTEDLRTLHEFLVTMRPIIGAWKPERIEENEAGIAKIVAELERRSA